MTLLSESCKIYAVHPVSDRAFSVLLLLDFFFFQKDFYFIRRFTQIGADFLGRSFLVLGAHFQSKP